MPTLSHATPTLPTEIIAQILRHASHATLRACIATLPPLPPLGSTPLKYPPNPLPHLADAELSARQSDLISTPNNATPGKELLAPEASRPIPIELMAKRFIGKVLLYDHERKWWDDRRRDSDRRHHTGDGTDDSSGEGLLGKSSGKGKEAGSDSWAFYEHELPYFHEINAKVRPTYFWAMRLHLFVDQERVCYRLFWG